MSFAKILAPLAGGTRDSIALAGAFAAAEPFGAHVVALFVRPDPVEAMPFFGEGVSGTVLQEIVDVARAASDKASDEARKAVAAAAATAGARMLDRPEKTQEVTVSFREVEGNFADQVARASRLADLVVFGPLAQNEKPGLGEAFEAVLLEAGRPVLLTAQASASKLGKRVAIGCDSSVASAHAVSAALPFLKRADTIEIFTVKRGGTDSTCCSEVREYLRLHELSCNEKMIESDQHPLGDAVLKAAAECGADLLVLGGYGHGRLRQSFFGGVTKHVVSHAALPLLLVH